MKIIAVHNILWSHYKARIFNEIEERSKQDDFDFHVLQLADTEQSRANLGTDLGVHQYSYQVLFPGQSFDSIKWLPKTRKLLSNVHRYAPDIIYLNGYYDPSYWFVWAYCKLRGIKVLLDFESTEISRQRTWWKEALKRFFLQNSEGIVCLGTLAAEYALKLGVRPDRLLSKKNVGIDNEAIYEIYSKNLIHRQSSKDRLGLPTFNFIYAGRFIYRKNLKSLIECFDKAQKKSVNGPQFGLILSGEGDQKSILETTRKELHNSSVFFIDSCEWYEVPIRYTLADVAVLPSVFEPFGFLTNEAMVFGLPVLVSERCGSAIDLIDKGRNGYTFDPYQQKDLVEKLAYFMDNPDQYQALGKQGQEMIRAWGPSAIVNELIAAFKKLQSL